MPYIPHVQFWFYSFLLVKEDTVCIKPVCYSFIYCELGAAVMQTLSSLVAPQIVKTKLR